MNLGKTDGRHVQNRKGTEQSLLLSENSPFIVTEAYKALRTNIMFSLPGTECKCIAVTSSEKGAGKSTNAINLAISLAQIEKKVILVDADMRLPAVAGYLHSRGQPGLSNLLTGGVEFGECDYRVAGYGIDLIPAGTVVPDPTRLLGSGQMEALMTVLRKHYNYIVIDLPPVNVVTDATLVAGFVDGYLLVVRYNSSEHRAVVEMLSRLKKTDAKILGFLYTGAEIRQKSYYRKYGYGN